MSDLRFGIVGSTAMITGSHVRGITENNLPIAAMMDIPAKEEELKEKAKEHDAKPFTNLDEMLAWDGIDGVALCTPHPLHCEQAVAALEAGKHVMTEKPMAVRISECDRMIEADKKSDATLAVIYQRRFSPAVQKAKAMIDSGELGRILRMTVVQTAYKADFYYNSGAWRGTWKGEGGGVLYNQAPHYIDLYQHLCGMPATMTARVDNLIHPGVIDVEDTASAIVQYDDGAMGMLHFNTSTVPGQAYVEIFGDKGHIRLEGSSLTCTVPDPPITQFTKEYGGPNIYQSPECETKEITLKEHSESHVDCYREVIKKIEGEENEYVSAESGSRSVELANAFILSSCRDKAVSFPLDRDEFDTLFNELVDGTTRIGK
jgi:UDP-N-acetyl-2-amino-2-deoxyglucuronate dehydrogenase